ncbi:hypothetical protein PoB_007160100 [Plakobranchus ocellatus]|uniref:Uncharacterized protein n=1 Tax=Plakobranchus ocellatus TaxID=259542 RepID=A0AAV4DLN9_9GAST|nr:hypothetical protein PoB_007160100 [Plakobranchus ocellatus]
MFPWDDRGDGHPSDTTLLNTLAPVLVAHGLLTHGASYVVDVLSKSRDVLSEAKHDSQLLLNSGASVAQWIARGSAKGPFCRRFEPRLGALA